MIATQDGKTDGVWTAGFASFTILILVHHIIIFVSTRNYSVPIVLAYIFSLLCFMPITVLLNENTAGTMMYKVTFSDILSTPLYWTIVLVGTVAIVMPFYFFKQVDWVLKNPLMYGLCSEEELEKVEVIEEPWVTERTKRREKKEQEQEEREMQAQK